MIYSVTTPLYREMAELLREAIGDETYFSGSVMHLWGDIECRLTVSLILYRQTVRMPEGEARPIVDAVPVWWEFHTSEGGEEFPNDFSFAELRPCLRIE